MEIDDWQSCGFDSIPTTNNRTDMRKAKSHSNICFRKFCAFWLQWGDCESMSVKICSCAGYFHKSWLGDLFLINDVSEIWDLNFIHFWLFSCPRLSHLSHIPRRASIERIWLQNFQQMQLILIIRLSCYESSQSLVRWRWWWWWRREKGKRRLN